METGLLCTSITLGRALGLTATAGNAQQPEGIHAKQIHIWTASLMTCQYRRWGACCPDAESISCAQGGATKLKEYMRSLNILPQKRKRKPSDGIPRSPRSPRSPDGLLPGTTISDVEECEMSNSRSIRRQCMLTLWFLRQSGHLIALGPESCWVEHFGCRQGKRGHTGWWDTLQPRLKAAAVHATPPCSPLLCLTHHESHSSVHELLVPGQH